MTPFPPGRPSPRTDGVPVKGGFRRFHVSPDRSVSSFSGYVYRYTQQDYELDITAIMEIAKPYATISRGQAEQILYYLDP